MNRAVGITLALVMGCAGNLFAQSSAAKDLFVSKCAICHGQDGTGKTSMGKSLKIRDLHSPDVQKQSDAELKTMISKGKNPMPGFADKVTTEQLDQLVNYVRELGKQK
jgi:mono/diheme cytochrome c family protein